MGPGNSDAILAALDEFGFGSLGLTRDDSLTADTVVQLGYPPQRIDLLTTPSGVDFAECWAERLMADIGGLEVPVIGLNGLIANKSAAGRDQDVLDAKILGRMLRSDD